MGPEPWADVIRLAARMRLVTDEVAGDAERRIRDDPAALTTSIVAGWLRLTEATVDSLRRAAREVPPDATTEHLRETLRLDSSAAGMLAQDLLHYVPAPDSVTVLAGDPATRPAAHAGTDVPARLGPYHLLAPLGHGGMGVVYRARHEHLGTECAVKVLIAGQDASPEELARFRREAASVARMGKHPNIVGVFDLGEQGGVTYYAMELIAGRPLSSALRERRWPPVETASLVERIARALHFAHEHGVIHRDVKPGNIMLRDDGEPQVMDFGLARDVGADARISVTGRAFGTPNYMAPEQALGRHEDCDARTDVYALGGILYEMLTGAPPHPGTEIARVFIHILRGEMTPPRRVCPDLPRDIETICLQCLEYDRARRYGTAKEAADDLARFDRGEPILARPVGRIERLWRRMRRNARISAALASLLVVVVGLLIFGGGQWTQRRQEKEIQGRVAEASRLFDEGTQASRTRAVEVLGGVLADRPGHPQALVLRARARLAEGDWEGAESDLGAVISSDPASGDAVLERARVRRAAGLLDGAIQDLSALLEKTPDRFEALLLRGEVRIELRDGPGARSDLDAALRCVGDAAQRLRVECALAEMRLWDPQDLDAGMKAYQDLRDAAERSSQASGSDMRKARALALLGVARAMHLRGAVEPALRTLNEALGLDPTLAAAAREKALCYFDWLPSADVSAGEITLAEREAERATSLAPGDARSWWVRAQVAWREAPLEASDPLPHLSELLDRFPHWAPGWWMRGEVLLGHGDTAGAEEAFQKALSLRPRWGVALAGLGRVSLAATRPAEAVERFQAAIDACPGLHVAVAGLAAALEADARIDRAREAWARAEAAPPASGDEAYYLGRARRRYLDWVGEADWEFDHSRDPLELLAVRVFASRALGTDPWIEEARLWRARAFALAGEWKDAVEAYGRVGAWSPSARFEALIERARIRRDIRAAQDLKGARQDLEEAFALRPKDATALEERGLLREVAGDLDGALADLSNAIELEPDWPAPRKHRADVLDRLGRSSEAKADLEVWTAKCPRPAPIRAREYFRYATEFKKRGPAQAVLLCDRAIAECAEYARAYYARSDAEAYLFQGDRCVVDLARACRWNPHLAGNVYVRLHDRLLRLALPTIRKGLNGMDASDPRVSAAKALLAGLLGDYAAGLAHVEAVLAADPADVAARAWRGWMLHRLGRDEEAEADLAQADEACPQMSLVHYFQACIAAKRGDRERAKALLDQSDKEWEIKRAVKDAEPDLR